MAKENRSLLLIFLSSLVLFSPSLFVFYTHDDFFHFRISEITSFTSIISFFNFKTAPFGWGYYRPLSTQVFYALGIYVFSFNGLGMHIILFALFACTLLGVYKLSLLLTRDKCVSLATTFLYATSATHFGHLYFLATQELFVGPLVIFCVYFFAYYLLKPFPKYALASLGLFLLSLGSKESAVVAPFLCALTFGYIYFQRRLKARKLKLTVISVTFVILLALYSFFHLRYYGVEVGKSYEIYLGINNIANNYFWYFSWSLNIPEMFLDYVGPGLIVNPRLFLTPSGMVIPTISLFAIEILLLALFTYLALKKIKREEVVKYLFGVLWFLIALLPVVFFSFHKFPFYLTVPLFGVVLLIAYILPKNAIFRNSFLIVWFLISLFTTKLTEKTHWVTQGARIAKNVYVYFRDRKETEIAKNVVFYDTKQDEELAPWYPSSTLKNVLSNDNFFVVFFPNITGTSFLREKPITNPDSTQVIESRQFIY